MVAPVLPVRRKIASHVVNFIRTLWFIVNGIPLMFIALLGLVSSLIGFDWLDDKCTLWLNNINRTWR